MSRATATSSSPSSDQHAQVNAVINKRIEKMIAELTTKTRRGLSDKAADQICEAVGCPYLLSHLKRPRYERPWPMIRNVFEISYTTLAFHAAFVYACSESCSLKILRLGREASSSRKILRQNKTQKDQ